MTMFIRYYFLLDYKLFYTKVETNKLYNKNTDNLSYSYQLKTNKKKKEKRKIILIK